MTHPDITLIHDADCPGAEPARANLRTALAALGLAPEWHEVCRAPESSRGLALPRVGSPTVLVDGIDVVPGGLAAGATCRTYTDDAGNATRAPNTAAIVAALRVAQAVP